MILFICVTKKLLKILLLVKNGKVNGVIDYFQRNKVMTTVILGYDISYPKEENLYKILSALIVLESEDNGCTINMSFGEPSFKIYG